MDRRKGQGRIMATMARSMKDDIAEVLFTERQLADIVKEMGARISRDYEGKNLVMVSVLKGSLIFMADLMREITIPCSIDFLSVSSYGSGTTTTGEVRILKDLDATLEGKDLLVVEDILDSGVTLSFLLKNLSARHPQSIRLCTLLDKPEGGYPSGLCRRAGAGQVHRWLRAGLCGKVPQSSLYWGAEAGDLR